MTEAGMLEKPTLESLAAAVRRLQERLEDMEDLMELSRDLEVGSEARIHIGLIVREVARPPAEKGGDVLGSQPLSGGMLRPSPATVRSDHRRDSEKEGGELMTPERIPGPNGAWREGR